MMIASTGGRMQRAIRWFTLVAIVSILIFAGKMAVQLDPDGKDKKVSSGVSFKNQTKVEKLISSSLTASGWDAERAMSGWDDWEPAIAADPSSSYVYQMTTRYSGPKACNGCPFPVIIFRASADGGTTWGADKFLYVSKNKQNDPEIEVANNGTIYVLWLDAYKPGVKFIKSSDHGNTWSTPIVFTGTGPGVNGNWSDKPIIAISPTGQDVYVAFNASNSYISASHNFGATFAAPIKTNNDTRYWFHNGGVVTPNGSVYFSSVDYAQDYTGVSNINVIRSTNAGASWTTTRVDTSQQMMDCPWAPGCSFGFFGPSAVIAGDSAGKLMLMYPSGAVSGGPERMYVRTSTDGVTWSARTEVSNGNSSVNNGFPAIATKPGTSNDFRVTWQDDRNGANTEWNTWYRRTTDGGSTWSTAIQLSDQTSGAPYKDLLGYRFPYGDYFEMAVDSTGRNHVIWGEGISYTGPGGTWYTRGQ
jgi:hypothetical protein